MMEPFPQFVSLIPVACCDGVGYCFDAVTAEQCLALGATPYVGCDCSAVPCPTNHDPMPGPCCFPDTNTCEMMSDVSACIERGGVWLGVGKCCSDSLCSPYVKGACCLADHSCEFLTEEECLGLGGTWFRGQTCEYTPCETPPPMGACCDANENCTYTTQADCFARRGEWHENVPCNQVDCLHGQRPPGCRAAKGPEPIDRHWSTDLWNYCPVGVVIRDRSHYPVGGDAQGWEPGFVELVSAWPVRALDVPLGRTRGDPTGHHFAKLAQFDDGFPYGVMTSHPLGNAEDWESSRMSVYRQAKPDLNEPEVAELGFLYLLGTYHAPFWTEAVLHSHQVRCGIVD